MQISGLNPSAQFGADDVLAIEINGVTYKLTGAVLADALRTIGNFLQKTGDTMTGQLAINVSNATPMLFKQTGGGGSQLNLIGFAESSRTQFGFRQFTPDSAYYEDFYIPSTVNSDTATRSYTIYTSKNPPVIYRDFGFNETVAVGGQLHKRIDSDGIAISGYTIIGTHVKMTSTSLVACTVTANTYNDAQLFIHILNQGAPSAITGTVRVAYVKNT